MTTNPKYFFSLLLQKKYKSFYLFKPIFYTAIFLFAVTLLSCDKGIEPKDYTEETGFSGTITFVGEWPADVKRVFIVVFKDPLLTSADFTVTNLKFLSREIPLGVSSYHFSSMDTAYIPQTPGPFLPGRYSYVAVVYQTTENLSLDRKDWNVAGIYYAYGNTSEPATMVISENIFLTDINITCDFNNPPPQPPGGEIPTGQTGFSGTITFAGDWPVDIKRAFIVVFQNPLLTSADFTVTNLKFLSREIPLGATSYHFSSFDSSYIPQSPGPFPPGSYAYVAVAYQTTELLSLDRKDWYVAGVYYAPGNTSEPATMVITENVFLQNININCDFNNPPPQPPGGN